MEIRSTNESGTLVVELSGRLDATWSAAVERALTGAIRSGNHDITVDMAGVEYISSAGLGILLFTYKELLGIQGSFCIRRPSVQVAEVLRLSGLASILQKSVTVSRAAAECRRFASSGAAWELFPMEGAGMTLRGVGGLTPWEAGEGAAVEFSPERIGLGVGAFATSREQAAPRLGEFLALQGAAAQLPPGGTNRPDFIVSEGELRPSVWMTSGLVGEGTFAHLLRFDATGEARVIGLTEMAVTCLGEANAVIFLAAVETAGLVGASLQVSPATPIADPFSFPSIRDRLGFTSERAFRDGAALLAGVVARPGSRWEAWLRPMGSEIFAHVHAAAFPYRPLQKGRIAVDKTVATFFESKNIQSVLHLLADPRLPGGAGESEFYRGACWVAPVLT